MKIENNAYAEFQGANKLHFGGGGGGNVQVAYGEYPQKQRPQLGEEKS